jgi:hypothetical protein
MPLSPGTRLDPYRGRPARTFLLCGLLTLAVAAACEAQTDPPREARPVRDEARSSARSPAAAFWQRLRALCGGAYTGKLVEAPPGDTTFTGKALVMHVRACGAAGIRVPFHVGANRSRTWVITRTRAGLRLKHDHRHEDGAPDSVTQYGGDARAPGEPGRLEFPADSFTARLIPRAATNVWTLEIAPGERFVYALRREGTDRRFRIEFDLTRPVTPPPPPWGAGRE